MYGIGFTETTTVVPILSEVSCKALRFTFLVQMSHAVGGAQLEGQRFTQLYLGLVLDILLFILFALSTMLIYSLLLIKVEVSNCHWHCQS